MHLHEIERPRKKYRIIYQTEPICSRFCLNYISGTINQDKSELWGLGLALHIPPPTKKLHGGPDPALPTPMLGCTPCINYFMDNVLKSRG